MAETVLSGVIRGRTVELDRPSGLPEGVPVTVTLSETPPRAMPPADAVARERLRRSAGAWADDVDELDRYLEWNRQRRKCGRETPG